MFKSKKEKLDKELLDDEMKEMEEENSGQNVEKSREEEIKQPVEKPDKESKLQEQVNSLRDQLLRRGLNLKITKREQKMN